MNDLIQDVWRRILPRVLERVGERSYHSWIEPLSVQRMHGGVVHLEAPSRWAAERATALYSAVIGRLLCEELGCAVEVSVDAADRSLAPGRLAAGPVAARPPQEPAERIIVDDGNRVAVRILERAAAGSMDCNPVLLFGPPGVGKTALARSYIRSSVVPLRNYKATEYLREFAGAMRRRELTSFRESFDGAQGLVLDEVHRMAGKKRGQAEFLRVLARMVELRSPVLLVSRHHPRDIHSIQPSLASRLLSGFVVEISPPKWEARMQCLRNLEAAAGSRLPDSVLTRIADSYRGGYAGLDELWRRMRERLAARPALSGSGLQAEVASVLGATDDPLAGIIERVAAFFDVSPQELQGRGQARRLSTPRQLVQYVAVRRGLSAAEVGRRLGGKTRAAISYSCKELGKKLQQDEALSGLVEELC